MQEIGKIKAIFGLGMTPIYGLKNGQIKSLKYRKVCKQTHNLDQHKIFCKPSHRICANVFNNRPYGTRARGYKPFSILNPAEHETCPAHKC